MMTGLTDTRKRSREDDFCESTPLSKRINNLHLNNYDESLHQQKFPSVPMNGYENAQSSSNGMQYPLPQHNAQLMTDSSASYDPELGELENPYYFHKNKLLHELHLERMRRNQTSVME